MSNQPENEQQQPMTSEETRQQLLTEIEMIQQVITELGDEELEEIAGGIGLFGSGLLGDGFNVGKRLNFFKDSAAKSLDSYQHSPTKQFLVNNVLPHLI
jgi:peptide subunit release factor RF-3